MARTLLIVVLIAGIGFVGWQIFQRGQRSGAGTSSDIGSTTITHPSYTYSANASEDMVFVTSPAPGASVTGTIIVKGYARGSWFFEGVFPVAVENDSGMVIGEGQGHAGGDWTTTAFVPFSAEIDLKTPYTGVAKVVLKKDNPSGDPARDASLTFPVLVQ